MKKSKLLTFILSIMTCICIGAGIGTMQSKGTSLITARAEDSEYAQLVVGDNIISVTQEDIESGAIIATFTVESAGWYTFYGAELVVNVGTLEGNIIGTGSLELEATTYFIVLGTDVISTPGEYVAKIAEGIVNFAPTVHEAGQLYSHESGIGSKSDTVFDFYFRTDSNDAKHGNGEWNIEYGATSVDNIKLTRGGVTTSVAVVDQGTIVRLNAVDHYMKFEGHTVSNLLPVQDGDVFTISGTFKCTSDETQMINITETTVTYVNGALKFSTDPVVIEAGKMYAHENGFNAKENNGNGFGFYFRTDANDAKHSGYDGDEDGWDVEYGATSADNIKLTRNGETTSVAKVGQGTIVRLNEVDHYMKLVPWTTEGVLPVKDGDVFTISGTFKCTSDATQLFNITETTVTYVNGALKFSTDPVVLEAGQMYAHETGFNANENNGNGFGFYFRTDANDAKHSGYDGDEDGWDVEYGATSADNIKLTRNGETTSVAKVGQGTIVRLNEVDHYMKLVPWTTEGVLPVKDGDVFTISGTFKCTSDATQLFNITETTVTYVNGALKFSTDPVVQDIGQMYAHSGGFGYHKEGDVTTDLVSGFHFSMAENDIPYDTSWALEYKSTSSNNIKLTRGDQTVSITSSSMPAFVKVDTNIYYLKLDKWILDKFDVFPFQEGDVLTVGGEFVYGDTHVNIEETVIEFKNGVLYYSSDIIIDCEAEDDANVGAYFSMAEENQAPYDDWSIDYAPLTADAIKLIRNGETTNIAQVGKRTVVKFDAKRYYLDNIGTLVAGDIIIIDGQFKCTKSGVSSAYVLNISESIFVVEDVEVEKEGAMVTTQNMKATTAPRFTLLNGAGEVHFAPEHFEELNGGKLAFGVTLADLGIESGSGFGIEPTKDADGSYTYTFDNWYVGDEAVDFNKIYVGDVVIAPKFIATPIEYTITFVANGETCHVLTFTVLNMQDIVFPDVPALEGYEGAWDKAVEDVTLENMTVTAEYTEIVGGGGDEPDSEESSSESTPESTPESDVESDSELIESAPSADSEESSQSQDPVDNVKGCLGSIGATSFLSVVALMAVAMIRRKRQ